jgi:hypothetical protein
VHGGGVGGWRKRHIREIIWAVDGNKWKGRGDG